MVDAMDFHIGRLMDYLKSIDEYENTVFIFTSDNGAASSPLLDSDGNSVLKNWFDRVGYNTDYESLGEKGSWVAIGPGNASIANSPLLYYKFHANEGGLRVPTLISGPGIEPGSECHVPIVQWDLLATFHDLSGSQAPLPENNDGGSLRDVFEKGNTGTVERAAPGIIHHYTCHYHPPISSIVIGDYKLMKHHLMQYIILQILSIKFSLV